MHVEVRTVKRYFVNGKSFGTKARAYKEAAKLAIKEQVLGPKTPYFFDDQRGEPDGCWQVHERLHGVSDWKAEAYKLYAEAFPHDESCLDNGSTYEPPTCYHEDHDGMCRVKYCEARAVKIKELMEADTLAKGKTDE